MSVEKVPREFVFGIAFAQAGEEAGEGQCECASIVGFSSVSSVVGRSLCWAMLEFPLRFVS